MRRRRIAGLGLAALLGGGLLGTAPAHAAMSTQELDCGGTTLTIRTNESHSSDNGGWSAVKIVDGGSGVLVPTSFRFSVTDLSPSYDGPNPVFESEQTKGGGNANHALPTISCSFTQSGTFADIAGPGETPPPGVDPSDPLQMTFTATAIARP